MARCSPALGVQFCRPQRMHRKKLHKLQMLKLNMVVCQKGPSLRTKCAENQGHSMSQSYSASNPSPSTACFLLNYARPEPLLVAPTARGIQIGWTMILNASPGSPYVRTGNNLARGCFMSFFSSRFSLISNFKPSFSQGPNRPLGRPFQLQQHGNGLPLQRLGL